MRRSSRHERIAVGLLAVLPLASCVSRSAMSNRLEEIESLRGDVAQKDASLRAAHRNARLLLGRLDDLRCEQQDLQAELSGDETGLRSLENRVSQLEVERARLLGSLDDSELHYNRLLETHEGLKQLNEAYSRELDTLHREYLILEEKVRKDEEARARLLDGGEGLDHEELEHRPQLAGLLGRLNAARERVLKELMSTVSRPQSLPRKFREDEEPRLAVREEYYSLYRDHPEELWQEITGLVSTRFGSLIRGGARWDVLDFALFGASTLLFVLFLWLLGSPVRWLSRRKRTKELLLLRRRVRELETLVPEDTQPMARMYLPWRRPPVVEPASGEPSVEGTEPGGSSRAADREIALACSDEGPEVAGEASGDETTASGTPDGLLSDLPTGTAGEEDEATGTAPEPDSGLDDLKREVQMSLLKLAGSPDRAVARAETGEFSGVSDSQPAARGEETQQSADEPEERREPQKNSEPEGKRRPEGPVAPRRVESSREASRESGEPAEPEETALEETTITPTRIMDRPLQLRESGEPGEPEETTLEETTITPTRIMDKPLQLREPGEPGETTLEETTITPTRIMDMPPQLREPRELGEPGETTLEETTITPTQIMDSLDEQQKSVEGSEEPGSGDVQAPGTQRTTIHPTEIITLRAPRGPQKETPAPRSPIPPGSEEDQEDTWLEGTTTEVQDSVLDLYQASTPPAQQSARPVPGERSRQGEEALRKSETPNAPSEARKSDVARPGDRAAKPEGAGGDGEAGRRKRRRTGNTELLGELKDLIGDNFESSQE